jgi:hypothetical protein
MGECGCMSCGTFYKLPIKGAVFYLIHLYPGCRNCVAPPGIVIRSMKPHTDDFDYWRNTPELPSMPAGGSVEWTIKAGMDPDEFVKAMTTQVKHQGLGKYRVKEAVHDLADIVWDESINVAPEAIEMRKRETT